MTREQWASQFCQLVGARPTGRNLRAIVSWIQAEGGTARFNPLNTTHDWPDSTLLPGNTAGVREYATARDGLHASAATLNYGAGRGLYGYASIRHALRRNRMAVFTLAAVERSEWGTGGLALACLPWVRLRWNHYRLLPINDS